MHVRHRKEGLEWNLKPRDSWEMTCKFLLLDVALFTTQNISKAYRDFCFSELFTGKKLHFVLMAITNNGFYQINLSFKSVKSSV